MSHRKFPFGIVMTHEDGWKLSYSGDTMPCRTFASVGELTMIKCEQCSVCTALKFKSCTGIVICIILDIIYRTRGGLRSILAQANRVS